MNELLQSSRRDMLIGILHANRKTGKPSTCRVCKEVIRVGELHAVVITRYGKMQQAVFKMAASQGRAMSKKAGLKYRRLHLKDCLAKWMIAVQHYRTEARRERKGRPMGSGQLPAMSEEDKLTRYRLVRRRAATLRLIIGENNDQRLVTLVDKLKSLNNQLEVDVVEDMARRDTKNVRTLNEKIRRVQQITEEK